MMVVMMIPVIPKREGNDENLGSVGQIRVRSE